MNDILNILIVGLFTLVIFHIINKFRNRKFNEPPMVYYKYPIIGHTWDYNADIDKFLSKCRQEYGEIFSIYVNGTVTTIVGKELGHEVFKSKNASFSTALEEKLPISRILGIPSDFVSFASDISKNVFVGQMHIFTEKIQREFHKQVDELICELDESEVIQNPRQIIQDIVSRAVTIVLVGEKLCSDKQLVNIFRNFSDELHKATKVPASLGLIHPWIFQQSLIMRFRYGGNHAKNLQKIVTEKIKPDIEERLEQERNYGDDWKPPVDCIQFMLNQSDIDKENIDYALISGMLLVITFASMSTTVNAVMNFLLDFGSRPEYWNDLIEEQEKINPNNDKIISLDQVSEMEKLDSFLKESLRLAGHRVGIDHKVIAPEFKFSNGYQVPRGGNIGIYLTDVHHSDENYGPNSSEFDGYRYLGKNSPASEVSRKYLAFGMGRHACPGRNFAINHAKILASILIKKYKIVTKSGTRPPNVVANGLAFTNPEPLIFEKRVKM